SPGPGQKFTTGTQRLLGGKADRGDFKDFLLCISLHSREIQSSMSPTKTHTHTLQCKTAHITQLTF
ncbi:unnamed protein product, partial [Staurois parvus]